MTQQEYFGAWYNCFDIVELQKMNNFIKKVYKEKQCYPKMQDIYRAFRLCSYDNLKVVMLGQDPYPNSHATGIAFANPSDTLENNMSPSLNKIKDCLLGLVDWQKCPTFDLTLESWEKQGVLLLNTAFTCEANSPSSHTLKWRQFTGSFLKKLTAYRTGLIFVLFGEQAQSFEPYIRKNNIILKEYHPAYYCRKHLPMPNVFEEVNRYIEELNGKKFKVKWIDYLNGGEQKD